MGFFSGDFGGSGDFSDSMSSSNAMAHLEAERAMSPSGTSGSYLSALADVERATGSSGVSTQQTGVPFVQPSQDFMGPVNRSPLVGGSDAGQQSMINLQQHIQNAIDYDPEELSAGSQIAGFIANLVLSQTPFAPAAGDLSKGLVSAMNQAPSIESDLGMRRVDDELGLGYSRDPVDSLMRVSGREPKGSANLLNPLAAATLNQNYQVPQTAQIEPEPETQQWRPLLSTLLLKGRHLSDILLEGGRNYG